MSIKLYELLGADDRRFSPYCWRTRMALMHKGLDTEIIPCKYTDKEIFAFSGQDRVPVIVDGQEVISDSWNIACYLEDEFPNRPSLFGGSTGRGEARFFNEWIFVASRPLLMALVKDIYDHVHPADRIYFRSSREERFGKTLEEVHAQRDQMRPAIEMFLSPMRAVLRHQPYFCGDAPAYADYIVFGTFQWARSVSTYLVLEKDDILYGWRSRILDLFGGYGRTINAYPE